MPTTLRILLLVLFICGCDRNTQQDQSQAGPNTDEATAEKTTVYPQENNGRAGDTARKESDAAGTYIGSQQCASCHRDQFKAWQHSHHDLAMQKASDATVLGNFNDAQFDYFGTVSRFYKKDGQYFVRTDGPDGALHDYPIAYTFGVFPLQQYLVEFPGGKLQALSIAWDSRSKSEGGQRWYHLNPDEHIRHGDELHWTGLNYNWNFMCADCHSTNLQKNFDLASQTYSTSWSEINVACEACHGPGSRHQHWAENPNPDDTNKGLAVSFSGRQQAAWAMDADTGIAHLQQPADTQTEIETCAQCHSRRTTHFPGAQAGDEFLDHFNPALLSESLYHADGQINDEVYVYGSFLQSKMHAAGVTCSNCHDPHSLQLRAEGNAVCAQCHLPEKFDTAEHHFHPADSVGAQCVSCHMPTKTYMQVDVRRDHSLRIPRPDLSDKLETPNACTGCHTDKSNVWAAEVLEQKFGQPTEAHYGEAIYAGRHGLPDAESRLVALIADESQPTIARATAISLLPHYLSRNSAQLLQAIAQGDDALLNLGLAKSLDSVPQQIRPALAIPLLYEDERVSSALAANSIAALPMDGYPAAVQQRFTEALNNYLASETFNADRPEALTNLAALHVQRGNPEQAEAFYRRALAIAPYYGPAYINLADMYRSAGREQDAEKLLRAGLDKVYANSPLQHSLGLSLVRQKRMDEAQEFLRRAAENPNTTARYIYVYAIALNTAGKSADALSELERGLQRFPGNREILSALVSINRESGNKQAAEKYEQMLR
ncbi:Tfp pilus assembly protein PilF [Microbulbifer donghaiensis]|uniref:Tfp pilus assembly protein PilF n=1 Tax=Microbulbifer donghaiensis TaxID=494016 RepID=A0A1M4VRJ4_9GAMM|nr:tetratricopeptide repeat protein [Microbulbifer donghaiensis]SHE71731.1 Tfp pilus assembly protein PilF [Microbulbifer donghaiensis]